jgi:fructose-1,6-bisphosphatase I
MNGRPEEDDMAAPTLDAYLDGFSKSGPSRHMQIAQTVRMLATAATELRQATVNGVMGNGFATQRGSHNAGGDAQSGLDLFADDLFLAAAARAGVDFYASEERDYAVALAGRSGLALAVDPLDGSSGIEANISIGTIFSLLPSAATAAETFAQPGHRQFASGFFIYGPQLALALTLGDGVRIFVFSPRTGAFLLAHEDVTIAAQTREFAINASNYRHWDTPVRLYVDDCLKGTDGPCAKDYNMRWIASLVAESYRILIRGGAFLYPGDARRGYRDGRLRLVYEASPIAMLVEQAGGAATDGVRRILDITPTDLHQRTPLVFGSVREVETIARYHANPSEIGTRDPLFGNRGLLRA